MPTATLTFKLPEEGSEHRLAIRAGEMSSALWEIAQKIRARLKYESPSKAESDTLEELRSMIPFDIIE